jgi:hypothetical protein
LLAGDYGYRAFFETSKVSHRRRAGAKELILLTKNSCYFAAPIGGKIERASGVPDAFKIGLVLEERADPLIAMQIIAQQLRLVRQRFDREGATMHGRLMIAGRFGDRQVDGKIAY